MSEKTLKQGNILVSKQYKRGGKVVDEEAEEKTLEVHEFATDTATVSCSLRMTINLGNYESMVVGVTTTLPTYVEELDDAKEVAFQKTQKELFDKVSEVKRLI